ncbi:hypothetical protein BE20_39900 [Sorangium cellulosum]|nr:hypothetical protein BE20_39900 [Sorangium cellulosum]
MAGATHSRAWIPPVMMTAGIPIPPPKDRTVMSRFTPTSSGTVAPDRNVWMLGTPCMAPKAASPWRSCCML